MRIRALIVDDEPLARERIRTLLKREPDVELAGEAADGAAAVAAIEKLEPDLVFLDVQMPEADGFAVVEAVGALRMPPVIFVTAYDKYALRAFDVQALDYLLKPFDRERFQAAMRRARGELERASSGEFNRRLLALLREVRAQRKYAERLVVRSAGRIFFLRCDELDWIEAAGNYLRLYAGKEEHLLRETMGALEARLDPEKFIRVHRSAIVNLDRIREMQPGLQGEYVILLRSGARVTLSRGYRDRLRHLLPKGRVDPARG